MSTPELRLTPFQRDVLLLCPAKVSEIVRATGKPRVRVEAALDLLRRRRALRADWSPNYPLPRFDVAQGHRTGAGRPPGPNRHVSPSALATLAAVRSIVQSGAPVTLLNVVAHPARAGFGSTKQAVAFSLAYLRDRGLVRRDPLYRWIPTDAPSS